MEKELERLGLSKNEAKTYLALVRLGESTLGPIEKETGLFKQSAYNVLRALKERRFIKVSQKNGVQMFSAADPEILLEQTNQQQRTAERLVPELHVLAGTKKYASEVQSYRGIRAFQAFHYKMLRQMPSGSQVDVLGAGGEEFLRIMRKEVFFQRYENIRVHKKISHNLLMYENQRKVSPEYIKRPAVEARFLPEIFTQPIATQIWPDRVAILLFGEHPEVVEIKSEKIRAGFKSYFDVLWKAAKR